MADLARSLRDGLQDATALAVLAVGSYLRGDDAAGLFAAEELEKAYQAKPGQAALHVLMGETAPENFTGEIRRLAPSHLLIIDAADVGKRPGELDLIPSDALTFNCTVCTHALPIRVLTDYLHNSMKLQILILGIQPAQRGFAMTLSPEVEQGSRRAVELILSALGAS